MQKVYACARLSISGHFFSHTFQSDHNLSRALGFILCAVLVFSDNKIIIERTKLLFVGSSVSDNYDVFIFVSFISIAIDSFLSYRLLSINFNMPNR